MVFVILFCQQVEAHDHDAQHHQHDTGRAVEGLGVRLIGKDRHDVAGRDEKSSAGTRQSLFPILPLNRQQDQPHYQRAKPRGDALV